eukprot:SAG31_NODE_5168_length_2702_cov_2.425663_1_plen_355_part_00
MQNGRLALGEGRSGPVIVLAALAAAARAAPSDPPTAAGVADARALVHAASWASISTISRAPETPGIPFGNIVSFADGTDDASTGVPYFLVSPLDESIQDLLKDPRMSLSLTAAQLENAGSGNADCTVRLGGDAESPPCTRVTLSGTFVNITGTAEATTAERALYQRHPLMKQWGPGNPMGLHDFFFAKLELEQVWVIDHYGGAARLPVAEYLQGAAVPKTAKGPCTQYFGEDVDSNSTTETLWTVADVDVHAGFPIGNETFIHHSGPNSECHSPGPPAGCHRYYVASYDAARCASTCPLLDGHAKSLAGSIDVDGVFDRAAGVLKGCFDCVIDVQVTCWGAPADMPRACRCPGA